MTAPLYKDAAPEYARLWDGMTISPLRVDECRAMAQMITANRTKYEAVGLIPWELIGVIHAMECDRFPLCDQHLHNGDPLMRHGIPAKTFNVPAGRGPFENWTASAVDAINIKIKSLDPEILTAVRATYIPAWLYFLERYNGFGYRSHGINSPYLFSFTNHYAKGKYVADGPGGWDANAVSGQCGAAGIIKMMLAMDRAGTAAGS